MLGAVQSLRGKQCPGGRENGMSLRLAHITQTAAHFALRGPLLFVL